MNGIDISRYQKGINLSLVPCEFVIIKATQGTSYTSPTFYKQMLSAIENGKKIGVYHYAAGGGYKAEADHFLSIIKEYLGKVILVLDWESDQNPEFKKRNHEYAIEWLKYVREKTGITPFIYMSKSVCRAYGWDNSFPLWCAQYKNKAITSYQESPWTDAKGFGAWKAPLIFQYTSSGRLPNYNGNLDLDKAYISDWDKYCKPEEITPTYLTIRRGSKGDAVKVAQTFLNTYGFNLKVDGIFGALTESATLEFQAKNNLIPDGIIGRKTWSALTR
jgi:lysozyme